MARVVPIGKSVTMDIKADTVRSMIKSEPILCNLKAKDERFCGEIVCVNSRPEITP
jgi:hypothetical protein